jgi:uncharacterized phiE125 gp8 family phage protein
VRYDEVACSWKVSTQPTEEPLTVEDAKQHARITDTDSDGLILSYIQSAREACEAYMGRALFTQSLTLVLSDFVNVIPLPQAAPLQSITSVKYYDTDNTQQTLASTYYDTDTVVRPGAVVLKVGQSWPSLQAERRNGRVEIVYVAGWSTVAAIPEQIKQGLRMFVTYLDFDRAGMEVQAMQARRAAENCWGDRIYWTAPRYDAL